MIAVKRPPVADKQARFEHHYAAREQRRIARGELSPEALGRLEAREQVKREREQVEAWERQLAA